MVWDDEWCKRKVGSHGGFPVGKSSFQTGFSGLGCLTFGHCVRSGDGGQGEKTSRSREKQS